MKLIDEIRRDNLRALTATAGSVKALAEITGVSEAQMSQWVNGSRDSKTGKPRGMRRESCARIERAMNKPIGWLDVDHGTSSDSPPVTASRGGPSTIPVAGYAKLGDNGWYEEVQSLGAEGHVEAHSSDPDAYALRVKGDSMFPAIRNDWFVVVEPNGTPTAGEYVAIAFRDGRKMVKEFLFRSGDSLTVQSVNGGTRHTLSYDEIQSVHAIGAVLMPSKHREIQEEV